MRHFIIVALVLILVSNLGAEPLYQSKDDYLQNKKYGTDVQLDRLANKPINDFRTSLSVMTTAPDIDGTFTSASPWLSGVNFGGVTFGGSISTGLNFFGSSLTDADLVPVQIIFSNTDSTLCQTFRRDLAYNSAGVGVFPGTAWDMTNPSSPRRINICFVEAASLATPNLTWDPGTNLGNREYIFLMLSSYDGTGTTYAGDNANSGASSMDVLFGYWPDLATGFSLLETLPATLDIEIVNVKNARVIPDTTENILTWKYDDPDPDHFNIYAGTTNPPSFFTTVSGSTRLFTHSSLVNGVEYFYKVDAASSLDTVVAVSKKVSATTQQPYSNMNLVGFLHEYNTYGDIWGYVDGGTEYALICARDLGVSIIDVTANPPVEVGFITPSTQGVDSKDIKIYQNYAILINEGDDVQIYDLSDVTNPTLVGTFTPDGGGTHNGLVEGDYLYLIGNHGTGGLEIVDISNPALPVEVGQFQPFYYHDIDIRNDTICATGIYGDGIDLIDVSNKTSPSLIARFNYAGSGAHNAEFSADGSHVFIGDEIGTGNYFRSFDITNPFSVTLASNLIIDANAVSHNCYLMDDTLLVMAHYTLGIRIWNVVDPANPFEVGYYDSFIKDEFGYQGCWSVYTGLPSGKILASDMQSGLFVLETNFSTSPPSCCVGGRGNVNGGPDDGTFTGSIDISDLVYLVAFMFQAGPAPICPEEADINGSGGDPAIDISDMVALVAFMFQGGADPALCP